MSARLEPLPLDEGVFSIAISTEEEPHLSLEDVDRLRAALDALTRRDELRAVVFTGGARQFCLGARRELLLRDDAPEAIFNLVGSVARAIVDIPVPTVAAMEGHAIGGGWMLGLWCDAVVMAAESLYGASFVGLGFTPGMGSTYLLPEILGAPLARELLLTGRTLRGAELAAEAPTIAHAVVPRAGVRARALALAEEMAQAPPAAVRRFKMHLAEQRRAALALALEQERRMHVDVFGLPETRAAIERNYA